MQKKIKLSIISCSILGILTSCSSNETLLPLAPQNTNISSNTNDISSQYIITAEAIIDKMPQVKTEEQQDKLVKDFIPLIKSLNRYALSNLFKHATKVLNENLKPNQDPEDSSLSKLIYPLCERITAVKREKNNIFYKIVFIAQAQDTQKQENMILDFEKSVKKLPKADIKDLIKDLNNEKSDLSFFVHVGTPLSNKLLKILESKL
ncbi:MAG: hypothetical protein U0354_03830 [Candidatus Sericytochromatia bacterium]